MRAKGFPEVLVICRAAQGVLVQISQMVSVDRVFDKDLPVAFDLIDHILRVFLHLARGQIMGPGHLIQTAEPVIEILIRFGVNKDQIAENTH